MTHATRPIPSSVFLVGSSGGLETNTNTSLFFSLMPVLRFPIGSPIRANGMEKMVIASESLRMTVSDMMNVDEDNACEWLLKVLLHVVLLIYRCDYIDSKLL